MSRKASFSLPTLFRRPVKDNYSPQWSGVPPPPGFQDVPWVFQFDFPASNGANYPLNNFPLPFDMDADYIVRGIWTTFGDNTGSFPSGCALLGMLRDPWGNRLADDYQALCLLGTPTTYAYGFQVQYQTETLGVPAPVEPEIHCPAGSGMVIDLKLAGGAAPGDGASSLFFYGVKRYRSCGQ
jgi:hypothetical protein